MERPETRFAWNGEIALAYQILGSGERNLLYVPGLLSNVDVMWEEPAYGRFLRRLASFSRLVVVDRRGYGCSERFSPNDVAPLEVLVEDLLVVLDAAEMDRAAYLGFQESNFIGAMFAATRPDRVSHLVMLDPSPTWIADEDFPWEWSLERWEEQIAVFRTEWGVVSDQRISSEREWFAEQAAADPFDERALRWEARMERATMSPGAMVAETKKFMATDIRAILPSIHVPTLVLHGLRDPNVDPRSPHYVANRIEGAVLAPVDVGLGLPWSKGWELVCDEVEEFVTGTRRVPGSDRILKTVFFSDIVGSSRVASSLGDRAWHELLERHHQTVRQELARFGGLEQDTAGDGFFAAFDGPARAVRCAQAVSAAIRSLGIEVRIGLHTGECEIVEGKASGIAVITGARIMSKAGPSEVLVSRTVNDLVAGSGLVFEDRGEHELAGVPGPWQLYAVIE